LRLHHEVFKVFWRWSDQALDHAMLCGWQRSVFGWTHRLFADPQGPNPRSARNFHMQTNGAEMLRLSCCQGVEAGVKICAPVHDAVMILSPIEAIVQDVRLMQQCMEDASATVLNGFRLRTEAKIVQHPDHYSDPRGEMMFAKVLSLL